MQTKTSFGRPLFNIKSQPRGLVCFVLWASLLGMAGCSDKHLETGREYLRAGEFEAAETSFKTSVSLNRDGTEARGALLAALMLQDHLGPSGSPRSDHDYALFKQVWLYEKLTKGGTSSPLIANNQHKINENTSANFINYRKRLSETGLHTENNDDAVTVIRAAGKEILRLTDAAFATDERNQRLFGLFVGAASLYPLEESAKVVLLNAVLRREPGVLWELPQLVFEDQPKLRSALNALARNPESVDRAAAQRFFTRTSIRQLAAAKFTAQEKISKQPEIDPALEDAVNQLLPWHSFHPGTWGIEDRFFLVNSQKQAFPASVLSYRESEADLLASQFIDAGDSPRVYVSISNSELDSFESLVFLSWYSEAGQMNSAPYLIQGSDYFPLTIVDSTAGASTGFTVPAKRSFLFHIYEKNEKTWRLFSWDHEMQMVRMGSARIEGKQLLLNSDSDLFLNGTPPKPRGTAKRVKDNSRRPIGSTQELIASMKLTKSEASVIHDTLRNYEEDFRGGD